MLKLYLKTIAVVILLSYAVLSLNQFGYSYFTTKGFNQINKILSQGTFKYIQTQLSKTPQSKWLDVLAKIHPKDQPQAKIISIKSLNLNGKNKSDLLNGNIVITAGSGDRAKQYYFLYYGLIETFAVQRIGNSQFALELMITEPINHTIKGTMDWIVNIISIELNKTPKSKWPNTLRKLESTFNIPLQIIPSNSNIITNKMRQELKTYSVTYKEPREDKSITTAYFPSPDSKQLLSVGPIKYKEVSQLFVVEQRYYFILLSIASLIVVIFLTWLFSRNVSKIYKITKNYSKGDFSQNIKIRPVSILHGIYENVTKMGSNLKQLIQSQQNMTRFVAHEVRTPLATMQFAIDSLKKEKNLSDSSHETINSIQEDIEDINKLISYFLLYYKTSSHELKLNSEPTNIIEWLNNITDKYNLSKVTVSFSAPNIDKLVIKFDNNLLRHVIDNVITNALKFAKNNVCITIETDDRYARIHVDDDGPGITTRNAKNIFEPFSTLDDNSNLGKHIGLGLSIAKSIVELHGGRISVTKSNELGGARFTIKIPN